MSDLSKALDSLTKEIADVRKAHETKQAAGSQMTPEQVNAAAEAIVEKRLAAQKLQFDAELRSRTRKGSFQPMGDSDKPGPDLLMQKSEDPKVVDFQKWNDDCLILSQAMGCDPRELKTFQKGVARSGISEMRKAINATNAAEGLEFVPTLLSSDLYDRVRVAAKVFGLFPEISMPSNPYKLPVVASDATAYTMAENTNEASLTKAKSSTPGSGNNTYTAKKIATRIVFTEESREDSIIPVLEFTKNQMAIAMSYGLEDVLINGDDSGTHQDSDTHAVSQHVAKAWKGLRKHVGASTDLSGGFTTANLRAMRASMGKYGTEPGKMAWIVSPKQYVKLLGLTEVLTVDKLGDRATLLSGSMASFDGTSIVISEKMRDDLNATGVYDGVTTTKGLILLVNLSAFLIFNLRQMTMRSFFDVENDINIFVQTWRGTFGSWLNTTNEKVCTKGYNFTA